MYNKHIVSVIIPAYNEKYALPNVIRDIPSDIVDDIIVVDNGSTDQTAAVARQYGARVVREEKRGYGAACLKGLSVITDTHIVVILDADYSDYPEQITRLLDPIVNTEVDFVIGSRILGHRERGSLLPQAYWGNKLTIFLRRVVVGFSYTDMGPFRAIRYDCLKTLRMQDTNFGWNVEMQVKAVRKGLRIQEVPVDYRKRIGRSKISGTLWGTIQAGIKIIYAVFKYTFINF